MLQSTYYQPSKLFGFESMLALAEGQLLLFFLSDFAHCKMGGGCYIRSELSC
jgi:hypothetical protein